MVLDTNEFNKYGIDNVVSAKRASAAIVFWSMNLTGEQSMASISQSGLVGNQFEYIVRELIHCHERAGQNVTLLVELYRLLCM